MTLREWLTEAQANNLAIECEPWRDQSEAEAHGVLGRHVWYAHARDAIGHLDAATLDSTVSVTQLTELYATEGKVGHLAHIGDARWWLIKRDRPADAPPCGKATRSPQRPGAPA